MGLGKLRSAQHRELETQTTIYNAVNLTTGETDTFTINAMSPDWDRDHYRGFMGGIPGAWRASILLSDALGKLPWHLYTENVDGREISIEPQPLFLEQPERGAPWTRMDTFSSLCLDLIWHGNGIALITEKYWTGEPANLVPMSADDTFIRMDERTGRFLYRFGPDIGGGNEFDQDDVIHVKGPSKPGEMRGMGVLEACLSTLLTAKDQTTATRRFVNAGVPTGVLTTEDPEMDEPTAERLKARWIASQQTRTIAVLNASTTYQKVGWNPSELQMIEARKFTLHEIALIMGVPLSYLGVETSNRTYRNEESESNQLLRFSALAGHLARFEQAFTLKYRRGFKIKANLDSYLRSNTQDRYQAYAVGIQAGWLMRSEARKTENLEPIEGIDEQPLPGMVQGTTDNKPGNDGPLPGVESKEQNIKQNPPSQGEPTSGS